LHSGLIVRSPYPVRADATIRIDHSLFGLDLMGNATVTLDSGRLRALIEALEKAEQEVKKNLTVKKDQL